MSWAEALQFSKDLAQAGRFAEFLVSCQQIRSAHQSDPDALQSVGVLLLHFGYLALAKQCFTRAAALAPNDLRAQVNLANVAREMGDHGECKRLYMDLLGSFSNHAAIRRNALVSLEYDPAVPYAERFAQAQSWGDWAIARAGGPHPRPALSALDGRPLRVGYVSADLCQHTVGLFAKDVLAAHGPERVQAYAYSAGKVDDWVTEAVRKSCQYRDVANLDDTALAARIREDQIDVLVDLSGHTAGSCLTVFALRPAPAQVSWLGYFATTGLPCMDAVLLDQWAAPSAAEPFFTERIVRLPGGRFCYTPVPWAPEVAALPCLSKGHITFGSFNNTAKYNLEVYAIWAKILLAVPNSRLVLKWRTFQDEALCQAVREIFLKHGLATERLELRGASFHADVLKEYADIDIALDPFPFTGGLTSCEALWMGVPVVTWPQGRVVSRQTYGFLSAIGLPSLAAKSADGYVRIAAALACDREKLDKIRRTMRTRMRKSSLMDVGGFTKGLEQAYRDLYNEIRAASAQEVEMTGKQKTVLHVGAGHPQAGAQMTPGFAQPAWREIRLDIDPANTPDIIGSMLDIAAVAEESVDAVYSAHNLEHVYAHEVEQVLKEFLRVLKPGGFLVVTCPDLQAVGELLAQDKLLDVAYQSQAGPITPLDILYGYRPALAQGNLFMSHKCGFTLNVLLGTLQANGFGAAAGLRRPAGFDLWALAGKGAMADEEVRALAREFLPG